MNLDEIGTGNFEQLAKIFNSKQSFICYDHECFTAVQAALCGCITIVIPGSISAKEWYDKIPYLRYGIAYGVEELQHAKDTMPLVREGLIRLEDNTLTQTQTMINGFI